ncbi:bacteriocin immunity protein [Spirillospora sp. CA-255316]
MNLRPELLPPQVSARRVEELGREIDRITGLAGDAAREAEAAFAEATGHGYEEFREYWGCESREEAALRAAWPAYPRVPDITRDELVEIVRRIRTSRSPEQEWYLLVLKTNTSHPGVSDLIFWPPPELESASPEQIVDAALSYRPMAL